MTNIPASILLQGASPSFHEVSYTICTFPQLAWCSRRHCIATWLYQAGSVWSETGFGLSVPRVEYRACSPDVSGRTDGVLLMWSGMTMLGSVLLELRPSEGDTGGALWCGGSVMVFKMLASLSCSLEGMCLVMRGRAWQLWFQPSILHGPRQLCGRNLNPVGRNWGESPGKYFRMWQEWVGNILPGLLLLKTKPNKVPLVHFCRSSMWG